MISFFFFISIIHYYRFTSAFDTNSFLFHPAACCRNKTALCLSQIALYCQFFRSSSSMITTFNIFVNVYLCYIGIVKICICGNMHLWPWWAAIYRRIDMAKQNGSANYQRGVAALVILALLKKQDMYGYQLVQEAEKQSGAEKFLKKKLQ